MKETIKRTANDLKIGDTFKKEGYTLTVATIEPHTQKNGVEYLNIGCYTNGDKVIGSFFNFKTTTKI